MSPPKSGLIIILRECHNNISHFPDGNESTTDSQKSKETPDRVLSPTDRWNPCLRCLVRDYLTLCTCHQDHEAHYHLTALSPFRQAVVTKLSLRLRRNLLSAASSHWRGYHPLELAQRSPGKYCLRRWRPEVVPYRDEPMPGAETWLQAPLDQRLCCVTQPAASPLGPP